MNYYWDLAGIIIDCKLITILLSKYLPDLFTYFKENKFELSVNNFIHRWLVCIFTQNFDMSISDIILDFFFLEGEITVIKSCLAIFANLRKKLMEYTDFEEFYAVLNKTTLELKNPKVLLYFLSARKFEFDNEFLSRCREVLSPPILNELRIEKKKNIARAEQIKAINPNVFVLNGVTYRKAKQCDPKYPFCYYSNTYEEIPQFLILNCQRRPFIKPFVIDDYYYGKVNSYPDEKYKNFDEYFLSVDKNVLCEWKNHYCDDKKVIDNSIALLDEHQTHSEVDEIVDTSKDFQENSQDNVYSRLENDKNFSQVRKLLLDKFNVKVITEREIQPYID